MKGKIAEIFQSVQGEGIYLGQKQIFVRFYGCNLGCKFCDTKLKFFKEYTAAELLSKLMPYKEEFSQVSFTGGEPLLQKDFLKEILTLTKKDGWVNYLETNGTLPEALNSVIDLVDIVAMDFKFPSSTGLDNFWPEHLKFLRISLKKEVFIKAVISRDTSEEDLRLGIDLIRQVLPSAILVLQPEASCEYGLLKDKLESFKEICERENIACCVIPQVHKLAGVS
jgi:7-carboxy-7-deazaguanine synthase